MYFRLQAQPGPKSGYLKQHNNQHETLMTGALVDESELESPWQYTAMVSKTHGLELSDFYPDATLMSKRFVGALEAAGVDNLQTFPAEIKNNQTNEIIRDFVAFNIVGMVSAANTGASTGSPLADVQYFQNLVLDPKRAKGLLMFRLAESILDIIVESKIADAIRRGGFIGVGVEPLEEAAAG
jgi:hypothetical protein